MTSDSHPLNLFTMSAGFFYVLKLFALKRIEPAFFYSSLEMSSIEYDNLLIHDFNNYFFNIERTDASVEFLKE